MKFKTIFVVIAMLLTTACSKTAEERIEDTIDKGVHALTADERPMAQMNAKAFYEKEFPVERDGTLTHERGAFLECRPSDSNFNGLVTCKGLVPQRKSGFQEVTRYCGYRKELVGCSDQDTVTN